MKIYTKKGDQGTTDLLGGGRIQKDSLRITCCGTADEAASMLGLAYSHIGSPHIREIIQMIQSALYALAAELASTPDAPEAGNRVMAADTAELERLIDRCTADMEAQTSFVLPGATTSSAALHVARTVVRRLERHMVALSSREEVREEALRYVNRLSDAIFALAMLEETLRQQVLADLAPGEPGFNSDR